MLKMNLLANPLLTVNLYYICCTSMANMIPGIIVGVAKEISWPPKNISETLSKKIVNSTAVFPCNPDVPLMNLFFASQKFREDYEQSLMAEARLLLVRLNT